MEKPSPKQLVEVAGISPAYASMILSDDADKARTPARSLAIVIFRKLGWRHPVIADLSEDQMKVLEQVEPWAPRRAQDQAA